MSRVEQAISNIQRNIQNKIILEVACGRAEFSIAASDIAKSVFCIDLDSFRLSDKIKECGNITFEKMNAVKMSYTDEKFDTVILYNAIFHLEAIIDEVLSECLRVVKCGGSVFVISSFGIDKVTIEKKLIPLLIDSDIKFNVTAYKFFTYVQIDK